MQCFEYLVLDFHFHALFTIGLHTLMLLDVFSTGSEPWTQALKQFTRSAYTATIWIEHHFGQKL